VVALSKAATAFLKRKSGIGLPRTCQRASLAMVRGAAFAVPALLLLVAAPAEAVSNKVRITSLSDVAFGTVANLGVDSVRSENVCVYADTATSGYNVTAAGTGPGGAFQLSSGASAMAFEVQWSSSSGQGSGTQLSPNVPLTGQVSTASHQTCSTGPATSASLIILLRSAALSSAKAGSYNGTLTLVVGPE
jgi:hypothetical protein